MVEENEEFDFDALLEEGHGASTDDKMRIQGSCMIKDLKKDDLPDSIKHGNLLMDAPKTNIRDAMFVGLEDESLALYKQQLVGNLQDVVKESISLKDPIPRKLLFL